MLLSPRARNVVGYVLISLRSNDLLRRTFMLLLIPPHLLAQPVGALRRLSTLAIIISFLFCSPNAA